MGQYASELSAFGFKGGDVTSDLLWSKSLQIGWIGANGMRRLVDGGVAIYGRFNPQSQGQSKGVVWRFDAELKSRWLKTFTSDNDTIVDARVLGDGSIITLADYSYSGGHCYVRRIDGWGHLDCAKAGQCADIKLADCDDSNPCTTDTCSKATGGCANTALKEGTPCGVGKKCSLLGFCQ